METELQNTIPPAATLQPTPGPAVDAPATGPTQPPSLPPRLSHYWNWPRNWELALAFTLGVCVVIMVQSAWKLLLPPVPMAQTTTGVDLNSADVGTLRQLPGVGPHLAARIVDHREKHGPFGKVDDLKAVHGIGPATLERLRQVVMISTNGSANENTSHEIQPVRTGPKTLPSEPIDINLASKEQLMSLPGIGSAMADRIIDERTQNGLFEAVSGLTRVRGIKGKTLEKLLPYVTVRKQGAGV